MRQFALGYSRTPSVSFVVWTCFGFLLPGLLGVTPADALTIPVTSTGDTGPGTLRQAMTTANGTASADTITFNIGTGLKTIAPKSPLPTITAPLTIDGSSQPGFAGKPLIVINGAQSVSAAGPVVGLTIQAANCTVKSLVINNFGASGIVIFGTAATGNKVSGCYIGTDATGRLAMPTGGITIFESNNNVIGGLTAAERNVISGNANGININGFDVGADNNKIQGNYIGTNAAGTAALPNNNAGLFVEAGAKNNLIGGPTATARNVISGNGGTGIIFFDAGTDGNKVQGNYIGTNAVGNAALPNHAEGITVAIRSGASGPKNTVIGGISSAPGQAPGNVIAANDANNVNIGGIGTDNTVVQGNLIGTNASGTAALKIVGATGRGVGISNGARATIVGGTVVGARNIISGNGGGVVIEGNGPTDNLTVSHIVQGNYIGTNISGNAAIGNSVGVQIFAAKNNTVGGSTTTLGQTPGNLIAGNRDFQVRISSDGASNNKVQGNLIGTNKDGSAVLSSAEYGVFIDNGAKNNLIGGPAANLRNVISGNNNGVLLINAGTESNTVQGNFIGTNVAGTGAIANRDRGIIILEGASRNNVGGTTSGAGNVISGNGVGIEMDSGATANQIQGNKIGTDITGLKAVPNTNVGILITSSAEQNVIGGTTTAARNIISGNGTGVSIDNDGTNKNVVQGNFIGVNANGAALGNAVAGIEITSGAAGNIIGGVAAGAANRIAFNGNSGVRVSEETTFGNTIRGNSIFKNGGLGINLESASENPDARTANAPTPNDTSDGDSGPNHLQNFPIITALSSASGNTTISGTLNSLPNASFAVDFYANSQGDPSGFGEGETYLGSKNVTTNATGNATFTFTATGTFSGPTVSTTATNVATGETSEFSPLSFSNVVTNTNDDGLGSLRTALRVANVVANTAVIFNIPAALATSGVFTIRPRSPLPAITKNGTVIDGTTQTAFGGNTNAAGPEIVLNGSALSAGSFGGGLEINADNCTVRGLVISKFATGISIFGTSGHLLAKGNKVEGCYIGTTAAGLASAATSNEDGIRLATDGFTPGTGAPNNIIGGTSAATRNVISNNGRYGVLLGSADTSGNIVQGNFIGLNPAGTLAVPNSRGIGIFGAPDNLIGGTSASARNVIFGNGDVGLVIISDAGANRNIVQGNYIGINASGTAALVTGANVPDIFGVRVTNGAQGNLIGGTVSGAGNVIAGLTNGIGIGSGSNGNLVQGNFIGLNATGTAALPNAGNGIIISGGSQNNVIGAARTATGAAVTDAGNRIAFSAGADGDGVRIFAAPTEQTIGNTVRGNRIFNSTFLGINLFPSTEAVGTATLNDAGDADSGPNNLQNFPLITSVQPSGSNFIVSGTLNSTPNKSFVLDLYRNTGDNSACGGAGNLAEGEIYVASQNVTTAANGNASFTFTVSSSSGQIFTLTATNLTTGDTSEFTPTPVGSASSVVTNTRDSGAGSLRATLDSAGLCGVSTITFNIPISDSGFNAATGAFTISVASPLPALTSNGIVLDGTSQSGFAGHPVIFLNGSNAGTGATGISFNAANCVIKGLVISGFKGRQVNINGTDATGNTVQGCYIGTDATGNAGVAGSGAGIVISGGAKTNKIGGTNSGDANLIAFNGGDGVSVGSGSADSAAGNAIRGNRIYNNSGLGINLNGGTQDAKNVTANDSGDADSGPNNLQNFPIITGYNLSGTNAVSGTLDIQLTSKPSTSCALDFFRATAPDPSGFGEGEFYLGSRTVTTDASGNYKGTLSFSLGSSFAEQFLCATATNVGTGDTSEFGPSQLLVGTVNTWGYNNLGQLGDGSTANKLLPQAINLNGVTAIAAGGAHSLALKSDGTVWGWGNNASGQLGDGTGTNRLTPVQVPGFSGVRAIAAGWYHSLALKQDGTVWSWGSNTYGQLGDGTQLVSALPIQVRGLSGVTAIAAGVYYSVALKSDGTVWCWGSNFYGQLGDGTKTNRSTPVQAKGISGIRAIAAGAGHTVVLKSNGTVQTFGWNANGQLGNGTTTDSLSPLTVSGVAGVGRIAAGYAHTLALDASGAGISAWGSNASGQLGDGTTTASKPSPVRVSNFSGVRLVAAGTSHSLAIKNDGTVWSWGGNVYGAIGDGTTTNRTTPVQSKGLSQASAVSGGFSHSMALGIRAGVVLTRSMATESFNWSSVAINGPSNLIELSSAAMLDATTAGDHSHYSVAVNGAEISVLSAAYANNTVTLKLAARSLQSADSVTITWSGLRDGQGQPLPDGQHTAVAR